MASNVKVIIFCGNSSLLKESTWIPLSYYEHQLTQDMIDNFWEELRNQKISRTDEDLINIIEKGSPEKDKLSGIKIVSIPDGIDWKIVKEPHSECIVEICKPRMWNMYGEVGTAKWFEELYYDNLGKNENIVE